MSKTTGMFKRCSCTEPALDPDGQTVLDRTGKPKTRELGSACPRLPNGKHGTWWLQLDLPTTAGRPRKRLRRGGFASQREAQRTLDAIRRLLAIPDPTITRHGGGWSN